MCKDNGAPDITTDDAKPASDDELLEHFLAAWLVLDIDGEEVVLAGSDATPDWPCNSDHAIVLTADNPHARIAPVSVNQAARARLTEQLRMLPHDRHPCVGGGTDWEEDGWLIEGLSVAEGCRLGREFDQHSFFLVTPDTVTVIRCSDEATLGSAAR